MNETRYSDSEISLELSCHWHKRVLQLSAKAMSIRLLPRARNTSKRSTESKGLRS